MIILDISRYEVLNRSDGGGGEVIDYGVQMVGAPLEWRETRGRGIKVGIIDTGIDTDHPDLAGNIKDIVSFADNKTGEDNNGHGTHVAGCVAALKNGVGVVGVAPEAELYIAKAFNSRGSAEDEAIYNSLQWMIDRRVDVINMSFSGAVKNTMYANLVQHAYDKGITLVCAAGNEGGTPSRDTIGYPAGYDECIAVTAVDVNKKKSEFSSEGEAAEVAAAGVDIYSTYLDGGYATLSGTSMATPIITGAVAILQGKAMIRLNRRLLPYEVRLLLNIYADDMGIIGRDREYGFGVFSFGRICDCEMDNERISLIAEQLADGAAAETVYAGRGRGRKYMASVAGILAILGVFEK